MDGSVAAATRSKRSRTDLCKSELGLNWSELNALVAVVAINLYAHRAAVKEDVRSAVFRYDRNITAADWLLSKLVSMGLVTSRTIPGESTRRYYTATEHAIRTVEAWAGLVRVT